MKNNNNTRKWMIVLSAILGGIIGLTQRHLDNIYALIAFIFALAILLLLIARIYFWKQKK